MSKKKELAFHLKRNLAASASATSDVATNAR